MNIDLYDLILCLTYQHDSALCIKVAHLLGYDEQELGFTLSYYSPKIPVDTQIQDVIDHIGNDEVKRVLTSSFHLHTKDK